MMPRNDKSLWGAAFFRWNPHWIVSTVWTVLILATIRSNLAGQLQEEWTVAAVPAIQIGEVFGSDNYLFTRIIFAEILRDGRIVVADKGSLDIRIFSRDGSFQKRIGRQGRGPGEFLHIGGMWITSDGFIATWDARNRRISIFSSNGDLVNTHRVGGDPGGGNLEVFFGTFSNGDVLLASLFPGKAGAGAVPDSWLLGRFSLEGHFKRRLGEVRGMWRHERISIPFSPMPFVVLLRDTLYFFDGYENSIVAADSNGVRVRPIEVPVDPQPSMATVWSSLEARLRQRIKTSPGPLDELHLAQLQRGILRRDGDLPRLGGLLSDDQGLIWAKTYDPLRDALWLKGNPLRPAAGGMWRVLSRAGVVIATVKMPGSVTPLGIARGRLLGVSTDSLGVEKLVIHAIQRR